MVLDGLYVVVDERMLSTALVEWNLRRVYSSLPTATFVWADGTVDKQPLDVITTRIYRYRRTYDPLVDWWNNPDTPQSPTTTTHVFERLFCPRGNHIYKEVTNG